MCVGKRDEWEEWEDNAINFNVTYAPLVSQPVVIYYLCWFFFIYLCIY